MKTPNRRHTPIAVMAYLAACLPAFSQTSIPINNAGFELPVLAAGAFDTNLPGWTDVGAPADTGALHPSAGEYPGGAAEGSNLAFVVANADGDGISQVLTDPSATLKPGTQYTLTVQVGNNATFGFQGYRIELLAGGVVLAMDENTQNPANGTFELATATFTYDAGLHEALLGESLEIRVLSTADGVGETNFDDVQLTVEFTETVADPGGPYTVFSGGSLQLDASGSVAVDGETITTYDWDLNNDGNFGDITGEMPAAISYSELTDVWDMEPGLNTIQLRVTDSADNTSTVSATVNLQDGIVLLISDNLASGTPIETFFMDNFINVAEIRHANFANFSAQETQDALNGTGDFEGNGPADIVIIGRTLSSANYQNGVSDGFNALEIPVICFTSYVARQDGNRLGWHASGTTTNKTISGDETTVTTAGATILGALAGTYDFFSGTNNFNGLGSGTTAFGGGEVLATIGGDTLAAYWAPGTAPGNATNAGVATFPGPRLLFNLDRDGDDNFINLTEIGLNAIIHAIDFATPLSADPNPPEILALDPENNAEDIYPGIGQLVATFSKPIELTGNGTVTIQNLDDGSGNSDVVIELPDALVFSDGFDLMIDLTSNLAFDTAFAVQISADAVTDLFGTLFAGIDDSTTWTFTTIEQNLNAPVITDQSPAHLTVGVSIGTSIVATFDQNIILGSGDILIKDLNDDSTTQTIPVSDASQVSATDNVLLISPASLLMAGTDYAVLIPSTAVRNFSDVEFAGISNDTDWTFRTSSLSGQLGILDLEAMNGINPATGEPWKAGDRYHLVYVTTDTTTATSTNIADYNAFVQADANDEDLDIDINGSPVSWFALGSTSTVNAVNNAVITGSVWAVHNSGIVATGAADFWNFDWRVGMSIADGTNHIAQLDGTNKNVWTGTTTGGVASGGHPPIGCRDQLSPTLDGVESLGPGGRD